MRFFTLRTVIRNFSKYPRDIVWKNAMDLEHVTVIHPDTNAEFHLMGSFPEKAEDYEIMIYRTKRKLLFFTMHSFGFRKIVQPYNLYQVEYLPLFGITSALNSILKESTSTDYKTEMVDEVVLQIPWFLSPLRRYLELSLARHAKIQCLQDEPFRERLQDLESRGMNFPYRKFAVPQFEQLTRLFRETV